MATMNYVIANGQLVRSRRLTGEFLRANRMQTAGLATSSDVSFAIESFFNQQRGYMSDYDNTHEDDYERKLEASNEARDAAIEFHCDNWLTAVTDSVENSNGTFDDVNDYDSKLTTKGFAKRKANSVDVFIETLHDDHFMERAAAILISLQSCGSNRIDQLFDDMARSYGEYQYEKNLKE